MKHAITPPYVFTPGASGIGTIDLSGISNFDIKKLYAIINITKNQIIYAVGQPQYGLYNLSNSVLTLVCNTSSMSSSDNITILYDSPGSFTLIDTSGNQATVTGAGSLNIAVADISGITGQEAMADSLPVTIASDQSPIPVTGTLNANITTSNSTDVLGVTVSGNKNNQIEINFENAPDSNLITNTTTDGATVTQANGHTLYSTSASSTSSAKGVSVQKVAYRPAHEIYAYFTAAFTTPTSASSYQRIGLYDNNNGFFIGYNGLTFGITKRTAGVDTFTAATSFNGDLLNANENSKFTRNGTPEAINLNYSNLFRIRFAWLGSASILFEVFNPDGTWITFHTIKQPNSSLNPSIGNPNLPMTVDVSKNSSDSTNLIVYTACWAAGTTSDLEKISATLTDYSLASLTRSVITGRTTAGGSAYVNVKVTPSGSLTTAIGDITGVVGQNTMANSLPVTIASNQTAVPISGTVTANIEGGNSTAVKVDGSAVTQPISGSVSIAGPINLPEYKTLIDESSSSVIYLGMALPGTSTSDPSWLVKKIDISGTSVSILYANGSDSYNQVWDNRTNLTYV